MSTPNIPPPPPRDPKKAKRARKKNKESSNALSWVLSLGVVVAAGALGHEWLEPVTVMFDDLLATLF